MMQTQHWHDDQQAARDVARMQRVVEAGYDLNCEGRHFDTPLGHAILNVRNPRARLRAVRALLASGARADPDPDGSGPLFAAAIQRDADVMQLLLDHGAAADREHDMGDPILDWATFDYRFETYGEDLELPEQPTAADTATPDTWLEFLDRIAIKYGKRRPDYLFLLRSHGARTYAEMHREGA